MASETRLYGCVYIDGVSPDSTKRLIDALDGYPANRNLNPAAQHLHEIDTPWKTRSRDGEKPHDVKLLDFCLDYCRGEFAIMPVEHDDRDPEDIVFQLNWLMAWIRQLEPTSVFNGKISEVSLDLEDIWYIPADDGGPYCKPWATVTRRAHPVDPHGMV